MILKRIYAENASNYDKLDKEFKLGLTLINGDNLSGKSSILDILRFAIYGNCKKSKKIEYLKKRGSTGALLTKIWFDYKGQEWYIHRFYGKERTAELSVDGVPKANGIDNVNKYITDNFISEIFLTNSNMCQQKDTSGLLGVPRDTERFNISKKIFELDDLKVKAGLVKADIDEEDKNKTKLEGELKVAEDNITSLNLWLSDKSEADLQKSLSNIDGSIKAETDLKDGYLVKLNDFNTQYKEIEKKNQEIEQYNKEYDDIAASITTKRVSVNVETQGETQGRENLKNIEADINTKTAKVTELQTSISNTILMRVPVFKESELTDLHTAQINVNRDISDLEEEIKFAGLGKCPKCNQEIKNIDVPKLQQDLGSKQSELQNISIQISDLETKKGLTEEKEREAQRIKESKIKLEGDLNTLQSEIEQLKQRKSLTDEIVKKSDARLVELADELGKLETKLSGMEKKEMVDGSSILEDIKGVNSRISEVNSTIDNLNNQRDVVMKSINEVETKKKDLGTSISNKERLEKEIVALNKKVNDLKEVRKIFEKQLPLFMVLNKLKYISQESNKFLHDTFDKYDITFEQAKDALSIIFTDNVTNLPSDYSNLSGYEEGLGGLSIRMGFSLYNTIFNKDPINWIALDEIDESFRDERAELLYRNIFTLKKMFQQIIMVTHKPHIKEILRPDDTIEVKNNGLNSYIEEAV